MSRLWLLLWIVPACAQDVRIAPKDDDPVDPIDTDDGLGALQPDIEVSPLEVRFGIRPPSCDPLVQTVAVSNVGDADLEVTNVRLGGTGKVAYAIDFQPLTLAPGETTDVDVTFAPLNEVAYNGALVQVLSNDPDEPRVDVDVRGEGGAFLFKEELFIQEAQSDVDVIWALDASCSMSEEIAALKAEFAVFIDAFVNLGLDYRIGVVNTTDESCNRIDPIIDKTLPDPVQSFKDAVDDVFGAGACGGGDESGFDGIRSSIQQSPTFLRDSATLAAIAVSDEADQSQMSGNGTPASFLNWLYGQKAGGSADVTFSAMVGPQGGSFISACPQGSTGDADPAPRYHNAIRQGRGVWGDICRIGGNPSPMTPFLQHASFVAAGLEFRFELSEIPLSFSPQAVTVEVNGTEVPWGLPDGWTYDPTNNAIQFNGTSIPDPGASIVIGYPSDQDCGTP